MVQKKNEKKAVEKEQTQVCEPSYKGLAYLLVIFLLFEFIVLCVVAFKYDVSFKPKNECRSYVTQALRREQMRRMRPPAPTSWSSSAGTAWRATKGKKGSSSCSTSKSREETFY